MTICIVDTSILVELLNVPNLASAHKATVDEFALKSQDGEVFLLPIAVLIETGNHVAQNGDGTMRRKSAMTFVDFARSALAGNSPFRPTPEPSRGQLAAWLDDFPNLAMQGIGLGDRSLIALCDEQRILHRDRRVYVWTLDQQLAARCG